MLVVDIDGLEDKVIPQIKNSRKFLESGRDIINTINIPSDFSYRARLRNIPQNILDTDGRVGRIEKWLGTTVSDFSYAEKANQNIMESLLNLIPTFSIDSEPEEVIDDDTKSESRGFFGDIMSKIESTFDYVFSGEWITDTIDMARETASEIGEGIIDSVISWAWSTGATIKEKIISCIPSEIVSGFDFIGSKISEAWDFTYQNIVTPAWGFLKATGASIANVVMGVVKGVCQLIESLLDCITLLGTAIGSVGTGLADGVTYLVAVATGDTEDWSSITAAMWKGVMGFVAEDHVDNAFKSFYSNNIIGKWLDENAIDIFKSDGAVTNVAAGLGYVVGIAALTIATFGVGTAATGAATVSSTAVSATIAGAAGAGKATQEVWGQMRDSSWSGIEKMYENGEISEEQLKSFVEIRNLSDEEWTKIKEDYSNGNIGEEEFKQMEQIREMPEDWTTLENGTKGVFYGVSTGVWEGIQWYLGGKLNEWTYSGSKVVTSATRIGVDTAFNALDTPYRSALDAIVRGNKFEDSWKEQGGWTSMITNVGIGLIGSAGGEIFDNISKYKITENIENTETKVDPRLFDNDLMKIDDIDEFWKANRNGTNSYGVDQRICGDLRTTDKDYYLEIKNKIMDKYNMSAKDAAHFMDFINSKGACSYAEAAGNIIDEFRKKPKEFEKNFGFSLYRINSAGEVVTNEAELLVDMYFMVNHKNNGGELFKTSKGGINTFTGNEASKQKYMAKTGMKKQETLNIYLKDKGIVCKQEYICKMLPYYSAEHIENVKNKIKESLAKGDKLSMGSRGKADWPVYFMDIENDTLLTRMYASGHATQVTGICDDGVIVSTWGKKGLVKFNSFENMGECNFQVIKRIFKKKHWRL